MTSSIRLAGCKNNNCPHVDRVGDQAQVTGTTVSTDPESGESVVEIPMDMLIEAAKEASA